MNFLKRCSLALAAVVLALLTVLGAEEVSYAQILDTDPQPGVSLFQLQNRDRTRSLITTDQAELNRLSAQGWEGVEIGLIYTNRFEWPGLIPLYRLYKSDNQDHLFTVSREERNNALSLGYVDEGVAGYVFEARGIPEREPGQVVVNRSYSPSTGRHDYCLYTCLQSPGDWQYEGMAFGMHEVIQFGNEREGIWKIQGVRQAQDSYLLTRGRYGTIEQLIAANYLSPLRPEFTNFYTLEMTVSPAGDKYKAWVKGIDSQNRGASLFRAFSVDQTRIIRYAILRQQAQTIADGTYVIAARHSNKVLEISGGLFENGALLTQQTPNGFDNQKFIVEAVGDGYYKITSRYSGKVLDVSGASLDNGARVIQWTNYGNDNQLWKIEPTNNGYYKITAKHSGKALDVAGVSMENWAPVLQWDYWGGNNQQWRFDEPADVIRTETSAIAAVRTIHNAQATYQALAGNGRFGTLQQLGEQGLIDPQLAGGNKNGYLFRVVPQQGPAAPANFEAIAIPERYPSTGRRSFYVNADGIIRGADNNGAPATPDDSPITN